MDREAGGAELGRDMRREQSSPQHQGTGVNGTAAQTTPKQPKENSKGPWQPAEEGPARAGGALLLEDAPRGGDILLKDTLLSKSQVDKEKTKEKDSQEKTKEKDSQDTNKEKDSQDTNKERETQGRTKQKESQETTKEKESQDITKERESQEVTKEKESQDTTKKESQDTTKEKESQEIIKEKESQDTTKEKKSQEITKEKGSQDTTKERESQAPGKEAEECEQKAVKEAKKERVKAAEQLKGYMRPTKARGVPALVARPAPRGVPRQQNRGVCVCAQGAVPALA